MHNVELMMSLIVASTALAGLQAVVVGQVRWNKEDRIMNISLRAITVAAFILMLSTVQAAGRWLLIEEDASLNWALWSFSIQVLTFVAVTSAFLVEAVNK
jgi:hypothetical protein